LLWGLPSVGDEVYDADSVKAAFLYRFTGYVDWPQPDRAPVFVFAVAGAESVASSLADIVSKRRVKDLPAVVKNISLPEELDGAQVLYVGPRYPGRLQDFIAAAQQRHVLLVTDREGALDEGSMVNFLLIDHRVRFEIALGAAQRAGLSVLPGLLSVAVRVRSVPHSYAACIRPQSGSELNCFLQLARQ
jgi:hypothetical protein